MQQQGTSKKADYTGVLVLVMALPIYLVSLHFVGSEVAKYIGICGAVHIFVVKLNWELRRHLWFWGAIVVSFVLHIPIIPRIPWPTHWVPGINLLPYALADLAFVYGVIVLLEKLLKKGDRGAATGGAG